MRTSIALVGLLALSACGKKNVTAIEQGGEAGSPSIASGSASSDTSFDASIDASSSKALAEATVIASSMPRATWIEVDADAIYIAAQTGANGPKAYAEDIFRMAKDAHEPPAGIASGMDTVHGMVLERGQLFLHVIGGVPHDALQYDVHVRKLRGLGGEPVRFADTWGQPDGSFAVGGGYVYFIARTGPGEDPREIVRKPIDGRPAKTFIAKLGQGRPSVFTVDAKHLYYRRGFGDDEELAAAPVDGTAPRALAKLPEPLWAIQGDGRHAYWTTWRHDAPAKGTVWRIAVDAPGATPEKIAERQNRPWGIVLDDQAVYWIGQDGPMRRRKSGGPVELLAASEKPGYDIAVDDRFVYWTSLAKGEVYRAPK